MLYSMISFEEFKRLDLRVAKVISAERVEGSEKLVKLVLDCGDKDEADLPAGRQGVAGIGKQYSPDELVGRHIVIVANLEPRMLVGVESQGMLLAADDDEGPVLLRPDRDVATGTIIK